MEDGYEFFAKRQLVTLFSAPNYCGEFDNAGGMMSVDDTLMCSFQVRLLDVLTSENTKYMTRITIRVSCQLFDLNLDVAVDCEFMLNEACVAPRRVGKKLELGLGQQFPGRPCGVMHVLSWSLSSWRTPPQPRPLVTRWD